MTDTLRAHDALRAVLDLHSQDRVFEHCPTDGCERPDCFESSSHSLYLHEHDVIGYVCKHCTDDEGYQSVTWPCATVQAVENVLGGVAEVATPIVHRAVYVAQERPGEISWRCSCDLVHKHYPLGILRCPDDPAAPEGPPHARD